MTLITCNRKAFSLLVRSSTSHKHTWSNLIRQMSNWKRAEDFKWFLPLQTRWKDNDLYGHVNNAEYVSYYDTAINVYLIQHCKMRFGPEAQGPIIHFMVHTECDYFKPISYPSSYVCGLAVSKIGKSSVNYKLGLFELISNSDLTHMDFVSGNFQSPEILSKLDNDSLCRGSFTHVFVDSTVNKPVEAIKGDLRSGYERILHSE